jgi:hypothetical protein
MSAAVIHRVTEKESAGLGCHPPAPIWVWIDFECTKHCTQSLYSRN